MKENICKSYTGVHCIDGSCPKALEEEYLERGMEVPVNCAHCWYYKGCEDCYFCKEDEKCDIDLEKEKENSDESN